MCSRKLVKNKDSSRKDSQAVIYSERPQLLWITKIWHPLPLNLATQHSVNLVHTFTEIESCNTEFGRLGSKWCANLLTCVSALITAPSLHVVLFVV